VSRFKARIAFFSGRTEGVKDIKSRVTKVHERRLRYGVVNNGVDKPTTTTVVGPRLFAQYTNTKELVGIDESRDELIKVLMDGNGVALQQGKIVSVVGFGGLGKTTLAKAVYEKIRALFDCCAFVSVSQTPDIKKLFKGLLYDLGNSINEETLDESRLINQLREFLKSKWYGSIYAISLYI
jgi:ATPase subunit of ABC transporter with duplicated ATPase domains